MCYKKLLTGEHIAPHTAINWPNQASRGECLLTSSPLFAAVNTDVYSWQEGGQVVVEKGVKVNIPT